MDSAIISCPICQNEEVKFLLSKNDYCYYRCSRCAAAFLHPLPVLSDFADQVYDRGYFIKDNQRKDFGYSNYDQDKKSMVKTFEKYLEILESIAGKNKKILDVGAATGFFIKIALSRGWEAFGVEVSKFAARQAVHDGLNVVNGTLKDFLLNEKRVDALTYLDVFEHITNPKAEIENIKMALNPNGLILINTPDAKSLFAKFSGRNWYSFMPPEHIVLYNRHNLAYFLENNGFEILAIKKIGKKFSLPYIFQILYNWLSWAPLLYFSRVFSHQVFNRAYIPLNVRDNFLIIARKKS